MCVFGGGGGYVHVSAAALGDQRWHQIPWSWSYRRL